MNSKAIRWFVGSAFVFALAMGLQAAMTVPQDQLYKGVNTIDSGGVLDVKGTLKIAGETVTATAAQLNAAAAGSVTNNTLNPLVVSNINLEVTASNVTASTSLTIPDGTIVNADVNAAAAIAQSKIATNLMGACSITNLSTLCTNILWFNAQGIMTNKTTTP